MALSAATVWEVRTAGSDTLCSGGFVAGAAGTDYSQQNAAQYTGTNLVIDGAVNTKVTSATHNFVAADVGNIMQITAGSGFTTGFFEIVSVAANAATLDRSAGTLGSTAGTFAVGGALLSPGVAAGTAAAQNTIWVKSGTYTVSSTTSNVALGRVTLPTQVMMRGYQITRGDDTARPVLQASGIATFSMVTVGVYGMAWNIGVDGATLTATKGFAVSGSNGRAYFCSAINCTNNGFNVSDVNASISRCYATGCTTQYAFVGGNCYFCDASSNTGGGYNCSSAAMVGCIANTCGSYGFVVGGGQTLINCTAYNNSQSGFLNQNAQGNSLINCISYGNTVYGFDMGGAGVTSFAHMLNCAAGSSGTADRRGTPPTVNDTSFITLTADPFVAKASGNFALNNTAGGGALLRGLGQPGLFAGATTTSYLDVGAAQHQETASGGGTGPNVIVSSGAGSRGGSW